MIFPPVCPACGVAVDGVRGGEPMGYAISYTWLPCLHTHQYRPSGLSNTYHWSTTEWKLIDMPWYRAQEETPPPEGAVLAVLRAVLDEGPHPRLHRAKLIELKGEWPTLYNALRKLVMSKGHRMPQ